MVPQFYPTPSPEGHARRKPYNEQEQPRLGLLFHHIMKKLEIDRKMRISVEGIPELKDILQIDRKQQLVKIREYTAKAIPQFPMELVVASTGAFQIIPAFRSVFD